ncbi:MAG: transposase [Paracoccaceae bacterium]
MINGLRGMVAEFGVHIARGLARVIGFAKDVLAGEILDLPDIANDVIHNLCEHLMAPHARVRWYEGHMKLVAKEDARVRLLRTIPRRWCCDSLHDRAPALATDIISALAGSFAAWLGLTPANKSSGGKKRLRRINVTKVDHAPSCRMFGTRVMGYEKRNSRKIGNLIDPCRYPDCVVIKFRINDHTISIGLIVCNLHLELIYFWTYTPRNSWMI